MKKLFAKLILFVFTTSVYGQTDDLTAYQDTVYIKYNKDWADDKINYVTDTVIFESGLRRHVLTGTTILPASRNLISALNYGISFLKVSKSECKQDVTDKGGQINDHINSIISTDSSLTIDFNVYDNCCYDFLCDISVDSTGTLNLITIGYGTYCFCDCCFGLTYHLEVMKGEEIPEINSIIINGNQKTLSPLNTQ